MAIAPRLEQGAPTHRGISPCAVHRGRGAHHSRSRRRRATAARVAALLLALLAAGCVGVPRLDVNLIGLAPLESTLFEQRLRLDFRLQNGSQQVIRATGFEVSLNVNGRSLARGVDDGAFLLTGLSETEVSAVVSTSLFEVGRQLLELPDRDRFSYDLQGRLFLDGWPRSVRFSRRGEITRADLQRLIGAGGVEPQPLQL